MFALLLGVGVVVVWLFALILCECLVVQLALCIERLQRFAVSVFCLIYCLSLVVWLYLVFCVLFVKVWLSVWLFVLLCLCKVMCREFVVRDSMCHCFGADMFS